MACSVVDCKHSVAENLAFGLLDWQERCLDEPSTQCFYAKLCSCATRRSVVGYNWLSVLSTADARKPTQGGVSSAPISEERQAPFDEEAFSGSLEQTHQPHQEQQTLLLQYEPVGGL